MTLATNIAKVKQSILKNAEANQRTGNSVQLLAVSKTRSAEEIQAAYLEGISHFGENYLQEALPKMAQLHASAITWHFIGPIQSNKTNDIATHFDWVHSVARAKIARRLNDSRNDSALNICLQVNISDEASKAGCTPDKLSALAKHVEALPNLRLRGLMTIPKSTQNVLEQRQAFSKLRQLFIELQRDHPQLDTLSMGMSQDMDAAIAEGATIVRIGTAIFGSRR